MKGGGYKTPTPKTTTIAALSLLDTLNLFTTGIGNTTITASVVIWSAALRYQTCCGRHSSVLILVSQNASTGMQKRNEERTIHSPIMAIAARRRRRASRIDGVGKRRMYRTAMDSFVSVRLRL